MPLPTDLVLKLEQAARAVVIILPEATQITSVKFDILKAGESIEMYSLRHGVADFTPAVSYQDVAVSYQDVSSRSEHAETATRSQRHQSS